MRITRYLNSFHKVPINLDKRSMYSTPYRMRSFEGINNSLLTSGKFHGRKCFALKMITSKAVYGPRGW